MIQGHDPNLRCGQYASRIVIAAGGENISPVQ